MLVLGIDPGTALTGYGLVQAMGNSLRAVSWGCIHTESSMELPQRLDRIYQAIADLIDKYHPEQMAVEQLFFNKNARTALAVGHARGVVLLAAARQGLPVWEYTPLQVKQAVTGYGGAEKQQVQTMVKALLALREAPRPDDVADALAVAVCHAHSYRIGQYTRGG